MDAHLPVAATLTNQELFTIMRVRCSMRLARCDNYVKMRTAQTEIHEPGLESDYLRMKGLTLRCYEGRHHDRRIYWWNSSV